MSDTKNCRIKAVGASVGANLAGNFQRRQILTFGLIPRKGAGTPGQVLKYGSRRHQHAG
jgi:hypothetical protein